MDNVDFWGGAETPTPAPIEPQPVTADAPVAAGNTEPDPIALPADDLAAPYRPQAPPDPIFAKYADMDEDTLRRTAIEQERLIGRHGQELGDLRDQYARVATIAEHLSKQQYQDPQTQPQYPAPYPSVGPPADPIAALAATLEIPPSQLAYQAAGNPTLQMFAQQVGLDVSDPDTVPDADWAWLQSRVGQYVSAVQSQQVQQQAQAQQQAQEAEKRNWQVFTTRHPDLAGSDTLVGFIGQQMYDQAGGNPAAVAARYGSPEAFYDAVAQAVRGEAARILGTAGGAAAAAARQRQATPPGVPGRAPTPPPAPRNGAPAPDTGKVWFGG